LNACDYSSNAVIEAGSCNRDYACQNAADTVIESGSCNCEGCCNYLEPGCDIPAGKCNQPNGACSGTMGNLMCPDFY
jgi:hypothetical protein